MALRCYGDLHGSRKSAGGSVSISHFSQPITLPQVGLCQCFKHQTVHNPFPFLTILIFRGKKSKKGCEIVHYTCCLCQDLFNFDV